MTCLRVCYALLRACTVCVEEKTIGTKIVLDAYDWRAHIGGKAPDDVANARMVAECMGTHKVRYTWYA